MTARHGITAFALLAFTFVISSCGSNSSPLNSMPPVVHAQSPAPSSISLDCSASQPAGQNDDGNGTFTLTWGPCNVNATGNQGVSLSQQMSYTLKHSIDSRTLDAWIGTTADSKIEVGYFLDITTPSGKHALLLNQTDKHQDVQGNHFRQWNLPLELPAGTQLTLGLALSVKNPETDCPCGIHTQWFFNHGID